MRKLCNEAIYRCFIGLIFIVLVISCESTKNKKDDGIPPMSIQIAPSELFLNINETKALTIIPSPEEASPAVTWTSSDTTILSISTNGAVTGILPGQATITATSVYAPTVSAICLVTITNIVDEYMIEIIDNESVSIVGYIGTNKEIIIPETILNRVVTAIGDGAFYNHQLTSLILTEHIVSIGDWAFSKNLLQDIILPNSLTSIGEAAFGSNLLTSIIIPNSVTSLGDRAFMINQLETVSLPTSIYTIPTAAFMFNEIESISIPSNITYIDISAFNYNKLISVRLGDYVIIETNNFEGNFLEVYDQIGGHFTREDHQSIVWTRM